jgi:hypothetical protein
MLYGRHGGDVLEIFVGRDIQQILMDTDSVEKRYISMDSLCKGLKPQGLFS